ncbi:MAG: DUF4873 domain-containing protein [Mycobacterium sp.]
MTGDPYDVAVVGVSRAERRLVDAGVTDICLVDDDLSGSVFDEATHTWSLATGRARIVITDQIRSGRENLAPYLGVAVHGAPNYFTVNGPEAIAGARLDYIVACVTLMQRTERTRIEVLFSTQRTFCIRGADEADRADAPFWRRMREQIPTAFDLSSHIGVADEVYDGDAAVGIDEQLISVRVRLSGRLDPIDGRYHWQGTILDGLPAGVAMQPVTVTIDGRTTAGRITERTQQGGYSVSGVGAPPYSLDEVEVVVPGR